MTVRTILAAALAAAATATTALAAGAATSPKALVLQKPDFPAGTRVVRTLAIPGSANHSIVYRYRGPNGPVDLTSSVAILNSPGQAATLFKRLGKEWTGLLARLTKGTGYNPRLSLPRYGDEQVATYHGADGGKLLVRSGDVLWFILLQDLSSQPGTRILGKAKGAAELRKYGAKQMRRVERR
jgi:hypothetical protein